jgi:uncharacterized protein (DUF736 family)
MATIGTFVKKNGHYVGDIKTAGLRLPVAIKPAEKAAGAKTPDFRVWCANDESVEIGAGWAARSKAGNPYISLKLDCPSFAQPVSCSLVQTQGGGYALRWSRPSCANAVSAEGTKWAKKPANDAGASGYGGF